ncbi:MAG: type II toxin-antitoxin system VapC family toxin, partial [Gaiellaceae bacterium]
LQRFILEEGIEVVGFEERHWREAGRAFHRFGKGRHEAALNYGDCMTYATARVATQPLLCLGGHFALTDLDVVRRR